MSREKFETWFENDIVGAEVTFPAFTDGEYVEGDLYDDRFYFMLQAMWMSWKAAASDMEAKCAALAAENVALKAFGGKLGDMHNDLNGEGAGIQGRAEVAIQQVALEAAIEEFDAIKTPSTDAFIAEQRAQGVTMCSTEIQKQTWDESEGDGIVAALDAMEIYAAKLRQGGAA